MERVTEEALMNSVRAASARLSQSATLTKIFIAAKRSIVRLIVE
jgi:hypothetical protein